MGRRLSPPYRTRLEAFPLHPPHHIINVDLLAIDRNKALPTFQEPRSVWRANRLIIVIIAIALIATVGIVAGVVVGLKPKKGTANLASNGASPALSSSPTPSSTSQTPVASSLPIPESLQLSFKSSSWIWLGQNGLFPAGDWAFRKTLQNSAALPTEAIALLAVDNSFSLYHNGQLVSAGAGWTQSTAAYIRLDPNSNVFAIRVRNYADTNGSSPAGLLASFQIKYTDGSTSILSADNTWRVTYPAPSGFQFPTFDDSRWVPATALGQYGIQPWGTSTGFPPSVSVTPSPSA